MRDDHPKAVEDYTEFALLMLWVNMLWIFAVLWLSLGLGFVVLVAVFLNYLITRLGRYRTEQEDRMRRYIDR